MKSIHLIHHRQLPRRAREENKQEEVEGEEEVSEEDDEDLEIVLEHLGDWEHKHVERVEGCDELVRHVYHGEKDGEEMQGVDYSKFVPIMLKAIQEQQVQIEAQQQQINTLLNK